MLNMKTYFSIACIFAVYASVTSGSWAQSSISRLSNRPNIVFILIDDMGARDLGCTGSTFYDTPKIDKMASEGMLFLNAYSAAPVCAPSRGAIHSGKNPARTQYTTVFDRPDRPEGPDDGLQDVSKYQGANDQYLEARQRHAFPQNEVLFAEALADADYATGFFGKWHMGSVPGYYPEERGFQVAQGYLKRTGTGHGRGHWGIKWAEGDFANAPDPEPEEFIADVLTDLCIDFIKQNANAPFVAVLSHYIVHGPIQPKESKIAKYEQREADHQDNPAYAAFVESVDDSVSRILETLETLGLEENTLVIFTSDNGGLTPKNTSNYPLMGGKSHPFEGGIRVPLIIKWPAKIKPGVSSERVTGMDYYPTMLAAAGVPLRPQQHVDGINLLPLITKGEPLKKRPLVFHFPHYTHATGPCTSIIHDGLKLIRFYNDAEGAYLLYHLDEDPGEQNDLAAGNPEMVKVLQQKLDTALKRMGAEMPIRNPMFDSQSKARKKNLKFAKDLAEKERAMFEARMNK